MDELLDALEAADEIERRHNDFAAYRMSWLPVQLAFLQDRSRAKAIRTGNQGLGKTTVGLAEDIFYCLGRHPYFEVPPPPIKCRIICGTSSQSIEIQEKLWDLLPKDELAPGVECRKGYGFRGRSPPRVAFKNGSVISFHTSYQDALAQAGGTIDRIHFDEPPRNDRVFTEARNRMIKTGGTLILTFTPVNAPVEYLRELVEKKQIKEHHSRMTAAAMTPVGASEPLRDKTGQLFTDEYIDELKRGVPAYQVPVVFDGEWEFYTVERVFDAYDPDVHALDHQAFWAELITAAKRAEAKGSRLKLALGGDHGDGSHKSESWTLKAIDDTAAYPRVYVLDEYVSSGATTSDMDARSILDMLLRNGQAWHKLDSAIGDRPWQAGDDKGKSNIALAKELARELALGSWRDLLPEIRQAKSGGFQARGSVDTGIRFLHSCHVRPGHFRLNKDRCPNLHEAFLKWDRKPRSPHVHVIDTVRYGTLPWQSPSSGGGVAVVKRTW